MIGWAKLGKSVSPIYIGLVGAIWNFNSIGPFLTRLQNLGSASKISLAKYVYAIVLVGFIGSNSNFIGTGRASVFDLNSVHVVGNQIGVRTAIPVAQNPFGRMSADLSITGIGWGWLNHMCDYECSNYNNDTLYTFLHLCSNLSFTLRAMLDKVKKQAKYKKYKT